MIAQGLGTRLGEPVVVDTRVGGVIIAEIAAKAYPDGYTLLIYSSALWVLPLMQEKPTYDPFRDFSPITLLGSTPMVLVVHPSVPAKSVQELIALAKAKPGELNFATGPVGATPHLAAELFKATCPATSSSVLTFHATRSGGYSSTSCEKTASHRQLGIGRPPE